MLTLPPAMLPLLAPFAPLFRRRVWPYALALVVGTLLAPGKRTVTAALRVLGLEHTRRFERYHRVLNRAHWSSLEASQVLLRLLVMAFAPTGPLLLGVDETIERRRGKRIAAKGIYRDPVRSSHAHFVKASGLRWVCLMLLVPVPWAGRVWALPFVTALAPSERYAQERRRRHKTLVDWARQLLLLVRRWWPERALIAVADSSYAALDLLAACQGWAQPVTLITRLRLDAALYEPAPPRKPRQVGRPRLKGQRRPTLATIADDPGTVWTGLTIAAWYGRGEREVEVVSDTAVWYHAGLPPVPLRWVLIRDPQGQFDTQALLCTDPTVAPAQILAWFVRRWQVEVTFEEARRHLGLETQRQWSELAIRRTTPALLGLVSLVTLCAHQRLVPPVDVTRQAAWYHKPRPTFSDALALVRRQLWECHICATSPPDTHTVKIPRVLLERLTETLCYAA
jgi:DDE superfamily endonuclease